MADITNEYGVDPQTGDRIAVDPPLQESETPLMGNPVLMRRNVPRKAKSNTALYAGAAVAVVAVLAGGAYLIASGAHQHDALMTNAATSLPAQQAAATPITTPISSPVVTSAPPSAPVVASAEAPVQPLHAPRAERGEARAVRPVERRDAARAASENGADAAALVTPSQIVPQATAATPQPGPAPVMVAPAAAPVITPPPAQ
ncbi:MAG: hypothetical protein WDM85_11635 [Caulobacteraceae bacterium]